MKGARGAGAGEGRGGWQVGTLGREAAPRLGFAPVASSFPKYPPQSGGPEPVAPGKVQR